MWFSIVISNILCHEFSSSMWCPPSPVLEQTFRYKLISSSSCSDIRSDVWLPANVSILFLPSPFPSLCSIKHSWGNRWLTADLHDSKNVQKHQGFIAFGSSITQERCPNYPNLQTFENGIHREIFGKSCHFHFCINTEHLFFFVKMVICSVSLQTYIANYWPSMLATMF